MATIYLVRHGKAETLWGTGGDPGLDRMGHEQAEEAARSLASLGPLQIVSSPLTRALETSKPLADIWNVTPRVDDRIGEIPCPVQDSADRRQWLHQVMALNWGDLDGNLRTWRRGVIEAIRELEEDTVLFSHFIAINAVVGAATGDDRVVSFWPQNASITMIDVNPSVLTLRNRGVEDIHQDGKNIRV